MGDLSFIVPGKTHEIRVRHIYNKEDSKYFRIQCVSKQKDVDLKTLLFVFASNKLQKLLASKVIFSDDQKNRNTHSIIINKFKDGKMLRTGSESFSVCFPSHSSEDIAKHLKDYLCKSYNIRR